MSVGGYRIITSCGVLDFRLCVTVLQVSSSHTMRKKINKMKHFAEEKQLKNIIHRNLELEFCMILTRTWKLRIYLQ